MQFTLQSLMLSFVVVGSALAAFGLWGILVAALLLCIAACVRTAAATSGAGRLVIVSCLFLLLLLSLDLFNMGNAREAARHARCTHNLKEIAGALHCYYAAHGYLPPARLSDASGKPLHSWRTLVLPFVSPSDLSALELNEPWDSVANKKFAFVWLMLLCPHSLSSSGPSMLTNYVAVVGPNTAWRADKPLKLSNFPDGGRHTIMLVELANSDIPWMEPRDLTVEEAIRAIRNGPHRRSNGYFHHDQVGAHVAFADSSVRFLASDTPTETIEALLTINDGKTLPDIASWDVFPAPSLHWEHIIALLVLAGSYVLLLFRPRTCNAAEG